MTATEPQSSLHIRLFGPFEVSCQGVPLRPLRTRKGQWLLALLALRQGREVQRNWLAGTLWPDSAEADALYSLRRSLTDLRNALGSEAVRLSAPSIHTLCLEMQQVFVDAGAFDAAMQRGDRASLQHAVNLSRGPLLEGCTEDWALQERIVRDVSLALALEKLASLALDAGDTVEAMVCAQRLAALDPLNENAVRLLMLAQSRCGNYAAVVQAYRDLRLRLRRDLRTDPDPETVALYKRLRAGVREQIAAADLKPAMAPPLSPPDAPSQRHTHSTYSVPLPSNPLIGREQELEAITVLLETSRLVTLMGIGGMGKTRLALGLVETCAENYRDGACFVELAGVQDALDVPAAVALALGLKTESGADPQTTIFAALRSQHVLLVLDNFEQVIDAAPFVGHLLQQCPDVTCLVTSRHLLGIAEERCFTVEPLPVPQPGSDVAAIRDCVCVQLFADRARAVRREFQVDATNAAAVSALCERLEGIPLAIELAAARVQVLTPAQMLSQLEHRFNLLVSRKRDAVERHRTLRNALDWSFHLLSPQVRQVFARLSVFRGGWTAEDAARVCFDPGEDTATEADLGLRVDVDALYEMLDMLTHLGECSLILTEDRQDVIRFRMLETVREYAVQQLSEPERQVIRRRHASGALDFATEAAGHLRGEDQAVWLERLETEHDNLREALNWCGETEYGAEPGLLLTAALWRFWEVRGYWTEGRRRFKQALQHTGAESLTECRARALNGAAILAWKQGDFAEARALYEQKLAVSRAVGDELGIAGTLNNLGLVLCGEGDYAGARAMLAEALRIAEQRADIPLQAAVLSSLADAAFGNGDDEAALPLYTRCLALKRELGDQRGIAGVLDSLGTLSTRRNDLYAARAYHEQGLALQRRLGDREGIAVSLCNLGQIARMQADPRTSGALYAHSLVLLKELGDRRGMLQAIAGVAKAMEMLGDAGAALTLYSAIETLSAENGFSLTAFGVANWSCTLAELRERLDPLTYASMRERGRTFTLAQAASCALAAAPPQSD